MSSTRKRYEPWLRDHARPRFPELVPAVLAAIKAFDTIRQKRRASPELLAPIVTAASSPRVPLFDTGTTFLSELTRRFAEARDEVAAMADHPRSHVRFNAILCLSESTPLPLKFQVVRRALQDKSASVREKAADMAGLLRLREVVPDLEAAAVRERNTKVKETIEFELKLLQDGYILEPDSDGGFHVTTHQRDGGTAGRWVSRSELKRRGVNAIVAELTKDE
jgi:hypothetical protein